MVNILYQPLVPKEYLPAVSLIMLILLLGIPMWHFGRAWWEWRKEEKLKCNKRKGKDYGRSTNNKMPFL